MATEKLDTTKTNSGGRRRYLLVQSAYLVVVVVIYVCANLLYGSGESIYVPDVDYTYRDQIEEKRPDTIMVGNSMLGQGVNLALFDELVGTQSMKVKVGGSSSTVWYLLIKNQIIAAEHKPKNLIVFFRDNYITNPKFRTKGADIRYMDQYASSDEPLLQELTFDSRMHDGGKIKSLFLSIYLNRERIKGKIVESIKYWPTTYLLHIPENMADSSMEIVFHDRNMNPELLNEAQLAAELVDIDETYEFENRVERSYLPEMIRMAAENDIQLHLVRVKRRRLAQHQPDPEALKNYINKLSDYLSDREVGFWDYSYDESITIDYYGAGDHLKQPEGSDMFTRKLGEDIGPHLVRE